MLHRNIRKNAEHTEKDGMHGRKQPYPVFFVNSASCFRVFRVLSLLLFSVLCFGPASGQSGYDLYQQALVKERAEGNLREAITIYQRVVSEHGGHRQLAARAQLRIGVLYDRLGRKGEAQRAYQAVIGQYSDQAEIARQAQARIVAPNGNKASGNDPGGNTATGVTVRRIIGGRTVDTLGSPSPDGRYLSFVNWGTGNLVVAEISSLAGVDTSKVDLLKMWNSFRSLTSEGGYQGKNQFAYWSVWSPDSKQVAYTWFNNDRFELRIIGLNDQKPRLLFRNEEIAYIRPHEWSRDGKQILTILQKQDRTSQIVFISVADGSVRVIKSLDWRYPVKMTLSPDGRDIVYDVPRKEDSPNREIFILKSDGTKEATLVEHGANDFGPVWSPDGKAILFFSNRTGTVGAWLIEVVNSRPQGPPELIKRDMGSVIPMGFTRKGVFYFANARSVDIGNAYTATLDPTTGKVTQPITKIADRFEGSNVLPAWSPDGRYLAYVSNRGPLPAGLGTSVMVIRSLESGEERELSPKLRYVVAPRQSAPRWKPDGSSLLVKSEDLKGRIGFFLIDARTGNETLVRQTRPDERIGSPAWSPDGKRVFYTFHRTIRRGEQMGGASGVAVLDLETGRDEELYRGPVRDLALSPDGEQLTFLRFGRNYSQLMLIPATGGETRELLRLDGSETISYFSGLAWTPEGRHVLFGKGTIIPGMPDLETAELCRVAVESSQTQNLGIKLERLRDISVHPDGKRIAVTAGWAHGGEIWSMENFLPKSPR